MLVAGFILIMNPLNLSKNIIHTFYWICMTTKYAIKVPNRLLQFILTSIKAFRKVTFMTGDDAFQTK